MTTKKKIPKRISTAVLNSLKAGVVPRIGLEYFNVGRKDEITSLLIDLENVAEGGGAMRFIIGRYGSGKTFMLQLVRNQAIDRKFVVADADLSPERRLTGSNNGGLATYRELMRNVATKASPDGGALASILQKWISNIQSEVMQAGYSLENEAQFNQVVQNRIFATVNEMEGMVHGFDYAKVISSYWTGYLTQDEALKDAALRWLRGEFNTKTEAKKALGVGAIVQDSDWYDYIKLFAKFVASIGYGGLVILIDEAVNLYKISNTVSRNNNYEKVLTIFNDTMQGKAEHLCVLVGGTPNFLKDTRRGLFSYEALQRRLMTSQFTRADLVDVSGPAIELRVLAHEEVFLILQKLLSIFSLHFKQELNVSNQDIQTFMQEILARVGAETLLTPSDVIRPFLEVLFLLQQNPDKTFLNILGTAVSEPNNSSQNDGDDFADFSL